MFSKRLVGVLTASVLIIGSVTAQQRRPGNPNQPFPIMPGAVRRQADALGSRWRTPAKAQSILAGEFVDATGSRSAARVIHQLPWLVRLQGFPTTLPNLSFDGEVPRTGLSRTDEILLETFVLDFPEGMFSWLQNGAAARLLGRRFGPDPRKNPNYTGPRHDIYEITGPIRYRQDRLNRMKRYYFDSASGLLRSTRYVDRTVSPRVAVETRFSNWRVLDGSFYPGRVERYENGRLVFSFNVASVVPGPPQDPTAFR